MFEGKNLLPMTPDEIVKDEKPRNQMCNDKKQAFSSNQADVVHALFAFNSTFYDFGMPIDGDISIGLTTMLDCIHKNSVDLSAHDIHAISFIIHVARIVD